MFVVGYEGRFNDMELCQSECIGNGVIFLDNGIKESVIVSWLLCFVNANCPDDQQTRTRFGETDWEGRPNYNRFYRSVQDVVMEGQRESLRLQRSQRIS